MVVLAALVGPMAPREASGTVVAKIPEGGSRGAVSTKAHPHRKTSRFHTLLVPAPPPLLQIKEITSLLRAALTDGMALASTASCASSLTFFFICFLPFPPPKSSCIIKLSHTDVNTPQWTRTNCCAVHLGDGTLINRDGGRTHPMRRPRCMPCCSASDFP